jgi:hypothetical protein
LAFIIAVGLSRTSKPLSAFPDILSILNESSVVLAAGLAVQFWTPWPTTWPFNFEQLQRENQGILLGGLVHSVGASKPNVI